MTWEEFMKKLEEKRVSNDADLVIWTACDQQVVAVYHAKEDE